MIDLEYRRKIAHLLLGIFLVILIHLSLLNFWILGILTIILFILFALSRKYRIPILELYFRLMERKDPRNIFPGMGLLYYLLGSTIVLILFTKDIAMASILILAFGDSVPNLVGRHFKKVKHPFSNTKFMEGAAAGILTAFFAAAAIVPWWHALIASIIAVFVEGIDIFMKLEKVDDNLIIPTLAGTVLWLLSLFS